jgi:putative peptidoglycan lipid II flippase
LFVVGGIAAGVAIVISTFARDLVELMFARGSFGPEEVEGVAQAIRYMAPGMVAMLLSVITLRALFCLDGAARVAAALGLAWSVAYFCMAGLNYSRGAPGIAQAYSIAWIGYLCCVLVMAIKKTSVSCHRWRLKGE